jgi:hypothetical protein
MESSCEYIQQSQAAGKRWPPVSKVGYSGSDLHAFAYVVINLWLPYYQGNFLTGWTIIGCSRTLLMEFAVKVSK